MDWGAVRCFPPVCREEKVDNMVFLLALVREVVVDHLTNWGCSVWSLYEVSF
jgi:hypothetical protein